MERKGYIETEKPEERVVERQTDRLRGGEKELFRHIKTEIDGWREREMKRDRLRNGKKKAMYRMRAEEKIYLYIERHRLKDGQKEI